MVCLLWETNKDVRFRRLWQAGLLCPKKRLVPSSSLGGVDELALPSKAVNLSQLSSADEGSCWAGTNRSWETAWDHATLGMDDIWWHDLRSLFSCRTYWLLYLFGTSKGLLTDSGKGTRGKGNQKQRVRPLSSTAQQNTKKPKPKNTKRRVKRKAKPTPEDLQDPKKH